MKQPRWTAHGLRALAAALLIAGSAAAQPDAAAQADAAWQAHDYAAARPLYAALAADPANHVAQYRYSVILDAGYGARRDPEAAMRYRRQAAEGGNADAQTNLGYMLSWGDGAPKDLPAGIGWLEKAVAQGSIGATYTLAVARREFQNNPAGAFPLMLKAAEAGDADAVSDIAILYRDGVGTAKDPAAYVRWLKRGAARDSSGRRALIAQAYANGEGVPRDMMKAYAWVLMAEDRVSPEGRNLVTAQTTPDQKAAAKAFADRCIASNYVDCD
jgi:TPR repeat protein